MFPDKYEKRVCNSDDPQDLVESGVCRLPEVDGYFEVRIFANSWDSSVYESWILQILLSELLGVPTSLETGKPDAKLQFYDNDNSIQYAYGVNNEADALQKAFSLNGDCTLANRATSDYQPCAHIVPEVWEGAESTYKEIINTEVLEPSQQLGMMGQEGWFMTKFTAEQDLTLDSYLGLMGEENRRKLADTFLRPTTWQDYCDHVSSTACTTDDGVASRPPKDDSEKGRFFVQGLYMGHFRKTAENDCDLYPSNCTGHIGDFPCGWCSFVEAQAYHHNIALRSSGGEPGSRGYTVPQLAEMWRAANATKSNLIMQWWTPEPLYQEFFGTDAAFHRVNLPPASHQCISNRRKTELRCSDVFEERVGKAEGACDEIGTQVKKYISSGLYEAAIKSPEAIRTPAFEVISKFSISEYQISSLFDLARENRSPREAVCQWASDNSDYLKSFIPHTYPRSQVDNQEPSGAHKFLMYSSVIVGGISVLLVLWTGLILYHQRNKRCVVVAQLDFLGILLAGSLMIAVGAVLIGIEPTDASCVSQTWLINIGYTLDLVPLIVKVAAINRLNSASRRLQRIKLDRKTLYRAVFLICVMIVVFLSLWTYFANPQRAAEYWLTYKLSDEGETIVVTGYYCSSDSEIWAYAALSWRALLLLCASVLAFQNRVIQKDFNESRTLAMLIYSHFLFIFFLVITEVTRGYFNMSMLTHIRSLVFSADVIATILIYFLPKFVPKIPRIKTSSRFEIEHGGSTSTIAGKSSTTKSTSFRQREKSLVVHENGNERSTNVSAPADPCHDKAEANLQQEQSSTDFSL
jgi:hypothetical protein